MYLCCLLGTIPNSLVLHLTTLKIPAQMKLWHKRKHTRLPEGGGSTGGRDLCWAVQVGGTSASEVGVAKGNSPLKDVRLWQPSWFRLRKMAEAGAASREQLVGWCTQQLRKTFCLDVSEEIMQWDLFGSEAGRSFGVCFGWAKGEVGRTKKLMRVKKREWKDCCWSLGAAFWPPVYSFASGIGCQATHSAGGAFSP